MGCITTIVENVMWSPAATMFPNRIGELFH